MDKVEIMAKKDEFKKMGKITITISGIVTGKSVLAREIAYHLKQKGLDVTAFDNGNPFPVPSSSEFDDYPHLNHPRPVTIETRLPE